MAMTSPKLPPLSTPRAKRPAENAAYLPAGVPDPNALPSWVRNLPDIDPREVRPWRRRVIAGGSIGVAAVVVLFFTWPSSEKAPTITNEAVRRSDAVTAAARIAASVATAKAMPPEAAPGATRAAAPPAGDQAAFERERAKALAYFRAGRYRRAAAAYERATKLGPAHAGVFAGLGAARSKAGDPDGALAAYREAVRLQPDHSGFRAALGRAYRAAGKREAAVAEYPRRSSSIPTTRPQTRR